MIFETLCLALAALYIGLFIQAVDEPAFTELPFWFTYALLASAFNIAWAFEVRSHWATLFGSVARCVITGEAIVVMLASSSNQRLWRCLCLGLGVAVWLLLQFGGLSWLGRVRLSAFIGLCITIGLCMRFRRPNTAALLHGGLLAVWSLTAVLASALGSRRGDAVDLGAMIVQGVTLFAWVWLCNRWERYERTNRSI